MSLTVDARPPGHAGDGQHGGPVLHAELVRPGEGGAAAVPPALLRPLRPRGRAQDLLLQLQPVQVGPAPAALLTT